MGVDYAASVIVGVSTNRDVLAPMVDVPGCEHKHEAKFCPECGAPAMIPEKQEIDGYDYENYKGVGVHNWGGDNYDVIVGDVISCVVGEPWGDRKMARQVTMEEITKAVESVRSALADSVLSVDDIRIWHVMDVG